MTQDGRSAFTLQATIRVMVTLLIAFLVASTAISARAQASSDVEKALVKLQKALANDTSLAPMTKEALSAVVDALQAERAGARAPGREAITAIVDERIAYQEENREKTKWEQVGERLKVYGDVRLRHESSFNQDTRADRHRERVRFRVGGTYDIRDDLVFGGRIVTGTPGDPNSTHQTLGMVFDKFAFNLDRLYLKYSPPWFEGSWVTAGKFDHPFYANPVYGELVWDADVQPEGIVMGYTRKGKGHLEKFTVVAGQYIMLEQSMADEARISVFQGRAELRLNDHLTLDLAAGYYHYSDVSPDATPVILLGDNAGNAVIDRNLNGVVDDFRSDYGIINAIAALTYDGGRWPLTVSGEYIKNVRADIDGDTGWALGLALGKVKKKGDWQAYYQYQVVERDAVFSPLAQDDFLFSTNHRSHLIGFKYALAEKIQLNIYSLVSQREDVDHFFTGGSDRHQFRSRVDLNVKF